MLIFFSQNKQEITSIKSAGGAFFCAIVAAVLTLPNFTIFIEI